MPKAARGNTQKDTPRNQPTKKRNLSTTKAAKGFPAGRKPGQQKRPL